MLINYVYYGDTLKKVRISQLDYLDSQLNDMGHRHGYFQLIDALDVQ